MQTIKLISLLLLLFLLNSDLTMAQDRQLNVSQQFRMGERIIRISEPGELADSINVWGDVGSAGRYLIPRGTSLMELISYSFGPRTLRDGQTQVDWSKMRVEINVQEHNPQNNEKKLTKFNFRFEEPFPDDMRYFRLENNQTVTVRVKRKPSFRDYLGVFASTVSAVASTIILLDRLGGSN